MRQAHARADHESMTVAEINQMIDRAHALIDQEQTDEALALLDEAETHLDGIDVAEENEA